MLRTSTGLLLMVMGDTAVAVGRVREAILRIDAGAVECAFASAALNATVQLDMTAGTARSLAALLQEKVQLQELPPALPRYGMDQGRRNKSDRRRDRANRWR